MLKSLLIYLSKAVWANKIITKWKVAWKAASRFVAGENIEDAINAVKELNNKGIFATLDQLGEHTNSLAEATNATKGIIEILERINQSQVSSNVSIKLTQIGLSLDEAVCIENLERILINARKLNNFIRIDMEDTPYTDQTIKIYREMRTRGYDGLGMVVQTYLYRTKDDTEQLLQEGACFRLVKGAYKEPAGLAFPKKKDVDNNFDQITRRMIDFASSHGMREISSDGRFPPVTALGSHDENRIIFAKQYGSLKKINKRALEFQFLFGIRRDLQEALTKEGYPVRVYVPFGTHWYPYFVRRLAERPANIWFFISNFFKK